MFSNIIICYWQFFACCLGIMVYSLEYLTKQCAIFFWKMIYQLPIMNEWNSQLYYFTKHSFCPPKLRLYKSMQNAMHHTHTSNFAPPISRSGFRATTTRVGTSRYTVTSPCIRTTLRRVWRWAGTGTRCTHARATSALCGGQRWHSQTEVRATFLVMIVKLW